ncbi:GOLPH3/VPS74 family protein [Nocardioides sp. LML1-1-1.1]|uniref:GOLPH3/VPS74 family protein n=1 Tax=Nocardioides sp. LML1-1-1.1 TaxID=3135248 RepID=UPI003417CA3B
MTIASDLVLLTIDPATGRSLLGSTATGPVLGGAVLVDLVLAERVAVDGDPKWAKAALVSGTSVGSVPHDRALARISPGSHPRVRNLVPRLGRKVRDDVLDVLVAEQAVVARKEKALGLFPVTRYDVRDTARRDRVLDRVRAVLAGGAPDETTGPLVALLQAGDVVKKLVPKDERRAAVRRAKEVVQGDWAGTAVRQAVVAATTAATTAISASAMVAASGGGAASS